MSDLSDALNVTASALKAQASRLRHVSENLSNVDTPGYRRKTIAFETKRDLSSGVETVAAGRVQLDQSTLRQVYDPSHPMANETGYFEASNVDLMIELADAREAQRSYEANLKMFDQARQMSSSLMDLLRR
ncbi:flagellar basal body rod protein FlgC [Aliisedimentitalea scapharcae]|uniref:Flagellar basal-body rod protein FlgC n=1 Tax=Aliisedimentitalea scapharcae TaxID=1524259 RepID=A0ABZ2XUQ7_9RHOB|nr:flagellar basal body rod protein FlgC [Rhodobacteraceae bacterium M382]